MDAISSAFYGLMSASNQLDTTAASLAKGTPADPATTSVSEIQALVNFKANATVAGTADQMTGALLDIKV